MREASHLDLQSLRFAMYTSAEIRAMSSCKVVTSLLFDQLGHPLPGGLYDAAMGPFGVGSDPCATCGETNKCPGHSGHTDLCALVYNPVLVKTILDVLRFSCLSCFKLQLADDIAAVLSLQLRLIQVGHLVEAQDLDVFMTDVVASASSYYTIDEKVVGRQLRMAELEQLIVEAQAQPRPVDNTKNTEALRTAIVTSAIKVSNKVCMHCKEPMKSIKYSYGKLVMVMSKNEMQSFYENENGDNADKSKIRSTDKPILPDECQQLLRQIYDTNTELLRLCVPVLAHSLGDSPVSSSPKALLPTADDDEALLLLDPAAERTTSNAGEPHAVDIFFCSAVPITPSTVRPANKLRNQIVEHPQTSVYRNILLANATLRAIMTCMRLDEGRLNASKIDGQLVVNARQTYDQSPGDTPWEKMHEAWQELQVRVNQTWDAGAGRNATGQGLKQGIEKKGGWIRMYTMGKRVNFAARTVITPDPYINVDEVGIPDKFAKKLSYPVPVTAWNVSELRKIVMNGPDVYPGANYVENERGHMQLIPANNATKRESMAKMLLVGNDKGVKIVHRHLVNGDVLLLNRQPSLHRPSIMAHKARILRNEKTFRLHYSNCKSYNADFDGDEMNAHCPQNELGRSEGYHLANVANHYLVPKDGTPLGGLIQDQVIAGVKISMRGRFFNREDYQQLVFAALAHMRGNIRTLPPAILKPTRLWSGKQIFSTILLNLTPAQQAPINLRSTAKIGARAWQVAEPREWLGGGTALTSDSDMSEAEVWIRGGEVLCGVMDKTHYGATPFGLIHSMYELYGGECSSQLLSSLAKLFTVFLQREGFTLGVHDILVLPDADRKRAKIIKRCRRVGNAVVAQALGLPEDTPAEEVAEGMAEAYRKDAKFRTILDRQYKSALDGYTNSINRTCLPVGLLCKFPDNNLQLMVGSGAKGSTVNTMQISCLLGQIELEGKRPPLMISGKSLPSFASSETSPRSGGFIDGRFMTGIQPQEFFFHCMAGREGLIDTAVKTSRSGYLQRCLIKHLEGLNVNYDMTVRDSDNSVVQFMYGEDGMDIAKAPFLSAKHLAFLDDNAKTIVNDALLADLQNDDGVNEAMLRHKKALRSWVKRNAAASLEGGAGAKRSSSFQRFSSEIRGEIEMKNPEKRSKKTGRRKIDQELIKIWRAADADKKADFAKKCARCPDPVFSTFKPDNHYGSISEYFEKLIGTYVKSRPDRRREFTDMMCVKSMRSFAAPGDPVGLLAAQSIGEPSTQMTLNTFHFAGRGEMNVTLGIPRLREILMMASANIKTPSMDIPFKPQAGLEAKAERLRLSLVRVTVHDVLESINVKTSIVLRPKREKVYKLRFNFLPRDHYKDDFGVRPKQVIRHMSAAFFKLMFRTIIRSTQAKYTVVDIDTEKKSRSKKPNSDDTEIDQQEPGKEDARAGGDSSDDEAANDEDDATAVKLKSKNVDECDYDEPEVVEEIEDAGFVSDDEDAPTGGAGGADDDNDDAEDAAGGDVNADDVIQNNTYASNYVYDREKHLWCELTFNLPMQYNKNIDLSTILKDVARKSVITEVPRIKRAITYNQNSDLVLKTDGINIVKMFAHTDLLDINRLYTNDIHAMARTYGIEAAARVVVKEVQNVFKVYGITVDPRHLLLIADYMTFDGTFKPMSRRGMESSASPLQQMSFESSVRFLRDATISGRCENLNSPSSRLMVGQPCKSGTGAFSLINNTSSEYMLRMLTD